MKRLRSIDDDFDSYNHKSSPRGSSSTRSSRSFYYKASDNARKGSSTTTSSSSSRYDRDRCMEDDNRESPRLFRKRSGYDFDGVDRRKGFGFGFGFGLGFDRYGGREGYNRGDRGIHRSESFCGASRRDFPKGFRSERDRFRREGSVCSWKRFKEFDESRGIRGGAEERIRSSPKGLRDVKSPTWSRDSGKGRSANSKSRSSPTWSKDSESEQSRSVEAGKKSVETETKGAECGSSSDMEEGELEPEPAGNGDENHERKKGPEPEGDGVGETRGNGEVNEEQNGFINRSVPEEKNVAEEVNEGIDSEENLNDKVNVNDDEDRSLGDEDDGVAEGDNIKGKTECELEQTENTIAEMSMNAEGGIGREKDNDLEAEVGEIEVKGSHEDVITKNGGVEVDMHKVSQISCQDLRDKGKGVAFSPLYPTDSSEVGIFAEKEPRNLSTSGDVEDMEGPSTRGFELFSTSPVKRVEKAQQSGSGKQKHEKLMLEALDLSLSLPSVLLPIGASVDTAQAPGSPSRSVQSFSTFQTNSNGFTASMSFSGSQTFFHNPSCSLTQNSLDMDNYEQSVHSRPIFQGLDQATWQGPVDSDSKTKDVPSYQRIMMSGIGSSHQSQALQVTSNGQSCQGISKLPNELERQSSFHKHLSVGQMRNHEDARSPSQSLRSHDSGVNYGFEKKRMMRDKHGSSLHRSNNQKEKEQLIGDAEFFETAIGRIVSDPILVMARKLNEMTRQSSLILKESIRGIILKADKQGQLRAYQRALQKRSDLTLDMLLKSNRLQLEILVALKTGLPEYLQVDNSISSSDLAEVFLNLRCRNLTCRSPIPVDECDCKVCVKKNGFCSSCMCLVCSKFDMASNTCSWVGCDVCLHWCHVDCALREYYIRNGRSPTGTQGTTEMQFHCVACDHPSEMFGFVKEVFQNFAKDWTAEKFCSELQYVKRIFSGSKDVRGRRLHEIVDQMLTKMTTKANLFDVYNHVMSFLSESESSKFSSTSMFSGNEQDNPGMNRGDGGPSQDSTWLKSAYAERTPQLERSVSLLPIFNADLNDKCSAEMELPMIAAKEPIFDELESIVRRKLAEAELFQEHADKARVEVEGLKCVAIAKNEKIEEEYASRISKLQLAEAEERRKQKYEEFQALERAHRDYLNLKMRMEADIKDLLLKMETTKRNLAM
ncbi:hypothetical protein K2173_012348 [Erythroxylum novogranatense]|uniref:Protein OBERON 4 n=1 Tax=Erythroxylum novogranatense TaxID=1862640 RepID=A0AAV8UCV9_9ROSI|nr:hypothetical protein K2173_012348 [Erythroxylum novogranatense]